MEYQIIGNWSYRFRFSGRDQRNLKAFRYWRLIISCSWELLMFIKVENKCILLKSPPEDQISSFYTHRSGKQMKKNQNRNVGKIMGCHCVLQPEFVAKTYRYMFQFFPDHAAFFIIWEFLHSNLQIQVKSSVNWIKEKKATTSKM